MITKERVIEELETVMDPEIGLDIYTIGLIYNVTLVSDKEVSILMTYTTPVCPFGPALNQEVKDAMYELGFSRVNLEITFDPPWKPPENLREMMGI